MNVAVRYYTKTGNTEKLAKAVAEAVGVEAKTVDTPLTEDVDVLFLCSSVYYAGADKKVKRFIDGIHVKVGKVVNISSAALIESTYKQIKGEVEAKGLTMSPEEWHCKGQWAKKFHEGRPNADDLKSVAAFAKKVISE
ncbi:MAG: flavodoxin family protein [Acutalibacteraceae bacterium]